MALPAPSTLLADAQIGDSIAVNGVCLTATAIIADADAASGPPRFTVGLAPETQRLTNLGELAGGTAVNVERAARPTTRLGGHFVQGHVDGTAEICGLAADGDATTVRLRPTTTTATTTASTAPPPLLRHMVFKGYVALDGTSLTVTRVDDAAGWWEVMLVPHTRERAVVGRKRVGDLVNVEVDVLAKYAEKSLAGYMGPVLEKMVQNLIAQAMGGHAQADAN